MSRYRIEPLQASHAVEGFDCGDEALNRFLNRFALANQRARASRTYSDTADGVGPAGRGGGPPGPRPGCG